MGCNVVSMGSFAAHRIRKDEKVSSSRDPYLVVVRLAASATRCHRPMATGYDRVRYTIVEH